MKFLLAAATLFLSTQLMAGGQLGYMVYPQKKLMKYTETCTFQSEEKFSLIASNFEKRGFKVSSKNLKNDPTYKVQEVNVVKPELEATFILISKTSNDYKFCKMYYDHYFNVIKVPHYKSLGYTVEDQF